MTPESNKPTESLFGELLRDESRRDPYEQDQTGQAMLFAGLLKSPEPQHQEARRIRRPRSRIKKREPGLFDAPAKKPTVLGLRDIGYRINEELFTTREWQEHVLEVLKAFPDNFLVQAGTGYGKTLPIGAIAGLALMGGSKCIILTSRINLVKQARKDLLSIIDPELLKVPEHRLQIMHHKHTTAADRKRIHHDPEVRIVIATPQSILRDVQNSDSLDIRDIGLVLFDEGHNLRDKDDAYSKLARHIKRRNPSNPKVRRERMLEPDKGTRTIAFTATPGRTQAEIEKRLTLLDAEPLFYGIKDKRGHFTLRMTSLGIGFENPPDQHSPDAVEGLELLEKKRTDTAVKSPYQHILDTVEALEPLAREHTNIAFLCLKGLPHLQASLVNACCRPDHKPRPKQSKKPFKFPSHPQVQPTLSEIFKLHRAIAALSKVVYPKQENIPTTREEYTKMGDAALKAWRQVSKAFKLADPEPERCAERLIESAQGFIFEDRVEEDYTTLVKSLRDHVDSLNPKRPELFDAGKHILAVSELSLLRKCLLSEGAFSFLQHAAKRLVWRSFKDLKRPRQTVNPKQGSSSKLHEALLYEDPRLLVVFETLAKSLGPCYADPEDPFLPDSLDPNSLLAPQENPFTELLPALERSISFDKFLTSLGIEVSEKDSDLTKQGKLFDHLSQGTASRPYLDHPKLAELFSIIHKIYGGRNPSEGQMMIQVSSREQGLFISRQLELYCAVMGWDLPITEYHGTAFSKHDKGARPENLDDFLEGRAKILVSTNIAGEGMDCPNLRYIAIYSFNTNPEEADQIAGRVRDIDSKTNPGKVFLLGTEEAGDTGTHFYLKKGLEEMYRIINDYSIYTHETLIGI